jgi:hypothetical protein
MLVCNWPHSVGQNHLFVMMLLNRDSAIQSASRRFYTIYKSEKFSSLPAVRTTWYTVWTPNCPKHNPSRWRELSVRTFLCVEKLPTVPAWIHPDVSAARPDDTQCTSGRHSMFDQLRDFFPKHRYGKFAAAVRTMWNPVRMHSFIRQVSHSKSRHLDVSPLRPDTRASDMEIACIRSTVRTTIPLVQTREALIWKLLAVEVQPSGRQGTTVRTSNHERISAKFWKAGCTVVRPDALWLPSGRRLGFIKPDTQLNLKPINRGP